MVSDLWDDNAASDLQPARVIADFGTSVRVALPQIQTAEVARHLTHRTNIGLVPKVGDWVGVRSANKSYSVECVLPRKNELVRKAAGTRTTQQILAANVDIAFVLLALDNDFSIERLDRYLYQLSADHISPIIVLNKADKTDQPSAYIEQLSDFNVPILLASAVNGVGVEQVLVHVTPGSTAILLGSSGVGKSTLTNQLLGRDTQRTQAVRTSDSTGKHTTVHRELFVLPNGGLLIDTPGIRELQLWGNEQDLNDNFSDVISLMHQCRYKKCQHKNESGCAIQHALRSGELSATHWANYQKMKLELVDLRVKKRIRSQLDNKKSHRNIKRQTNIELRELHDETRVEPSDG